MASDKAGFGEASDAVVNEHHLGGIAVAIVALLGDVDVISWASHWGWATG